MLELRNFSTGYSGIPVLSHVSITFPKEMVTIVAGPNGCGKSTLLKAMAGILPSSGEILLDGEDLNRLSSRERAQRVAFLPQNRQVPDISVERLVLHGRFPYLSYPRQYREADHEAARAAIETMQLSGLAQRPLASLSGGQQQRAYLAMALAQDTSAVLLDEPTSFLDIAHQLQLMDLAKELAAKGKTVVLVLHDLTLALEHGHHLVLMNRGQVVSQGTPEAVFQSGTLADVFGVGLGRTKAGETWKYFYL